MIRRGWMGSFLRRSAMAALAVALSATFVGTGSGISGIAAAGDALAQGLKPAKPDSTGLRGKLSSRLTTAQGRTTAFIELAEQPAVDAFNAEQNKGSGADKAKAAANAAKAGVSGAVASVVG